MTKIVESTQIGLEQEQIEGVVQRLALHLADLHVLYTKTRNYHWNVVGPSFKELHALFEEQYTAIAEAIDEIAERIRSLGRPAIGTLTEFCQIARLSEHPGVYPDATTMLSNLLADHEQVIRALREDVDATAEQHHDMGTSDFLTGLMEAHEKMAWMLRAYLES